METKTYQWVDPTSNEITTLNVDELTAYVLDKIGSKQMDVEMATSILYEMVKTGSSGEVLSNSITPNAKLKIIVTTKVMNGKSVVSMKDVNNNMIAISVINESLPEEVIETELTFPIKAYDVDVFLKNRNESIKTTKTINDTYVNSDLLILSHIEKEIKEDENI